MMMKDETFASHMFKYFYYLKNVWVQNNRPCFVFQVFQGSNNPTDEVRAFFPKATLTRYIRIRPLTWEQGICLRFELYGCKISGNRQTQT